MEPEEPTSCRPGILPLDLPVWSLITVNGATIVIALVEGWDLGIVMFIYWVQSIIIGLFTVVRILSLDQADFTSTIMVAAATVEGGYKAVPENIFRFGRFFMAGFFALHYGLFHFGYYTFLQDFGLFAHADPLVHTEIFIACGLFFFNHLYSYLSHRRRDPVSGDYLKDLFFRPYYRIIPMHLTIMLGGFASILLLAAGFDATPVLIVIFLGIKTYVDVRMHLDKHASVASPA